MPSRLDPNSGRIAALQQLMLRASKRRSHLRATPRAKELAGAIGCPFGIRMLQHETTCTKRRHLRFVLKLERCSPAVSPFPSPIRIFNAGNCGKPAQPANGLIVRDYDIDKRKHRNTLLPLLRLRDTSLGPGLFRKREMSPWHSQGPVPSPFDQRTYSDGRSGCKTNTVKTCASSSQMPRYRIWRHPRTPALDSLMSVAQKLKV
jgi:hypothetical protein